MSATTESFTGATRTTIPTGVILEGSRGWRIHADVIDLAVSRGLRLDSVEAAALAAYKDGNSTQMPAALSVLDHGGLLDIAEQYLNDHVAGPGHCFGFYDGEFCYYPVEVQ